MIRSSLAKRPTRTRRPHIDVLEQRAMLAADLGFDTPADPATVLGVNSSQEATPFTLAEGFTQTAVQRESTDPDLGDNLGQNTLNESGPQVGRFLFTTARDGTVNRTDLATGQTIDLLDIAVAELQDPDDPDATLADHLSLQNLSAIRWTPWGTLLVAEAIDSTDIDNFVPDPDVGSAANGLVYEIVNPTSSQPVIIPRPALGSANFEGLDFDSSGNLYYDDSFGGQSTIFRFVPDSPNSEFALESGVLSVLYVESGSFGEAIWQEITDPVIAQDDVRLALDALDPLNNEFFTTFNDARDLEVGRLDLGDDDEFDQTEINRDDVLYVALAGANRVIGIDLDGAQGDPEAPFVYNFVDDSLDPDFNAPADLSVDAAGRVYIGEAGDPAPGPTDAGNDIWVAIDFDDDIDSDAGFDPIADEIGRLASLRVAGASVSGLYVNPFNNSQIYVNVSGSTSNRDGIFLLARETLEPGVTEVDLGNGEIVVSIVGTDNSDRIIITGNNLLKVKIGLTIFPNVAPTSNVIVYGLGGDDYITTSTGTFFDFTVFGGAGSDYIATGQGDDTLSGEAGNDRINAGNGDNFVSGGAGNDSLVGGKGDDILEGDAGNDRLTSNGGNDTLRGGDGNDILNAGHGDDFADGGAGNDNIDGYFGDDVLLGGSGADIIKGGSGQDILIGGSGADQLRGGDGEDVLIGEGTAADASEDDLRAFAELWFFASFADDRDFQVEEFLDGLDGDDDDDGFIADVSKDLLDGGAGLDLFYIVAGRDVARFINLGDEVVEL